MEHHYYKGLVTMKITLLYQVSLKYIRVKKKEILSVGTCKITLLYEGLLGISVLFITKFHCIVLALLFANYHCVKSFINYPYNYHTM